MNGDSTLRERYASLHRRVASACEAAGRPAGSVAILAVSKTFPAAQVLALAALGQRAFGESYLQEALAKIDACEAERRQALAERHGEAAADGCSGAAGNGGLHGTAAGSNGGAADGGGHDETAAGAWPAAPLQWHFIGPLQSNKTRPVAERFDWVHSVDRERIARRLSEQRPAGLAPLNVCVQVNVSGEQSKSGCAPQEALALARAVLLLPGLRLRGVMAIPAPSSDSGVQRAQCARVREVFETLRAAGLEVDTLSMGMSDDLEAAIAEGATIVRVGSALFGRRPAAQPREP